MMQVLQPDTFRMPQAADRFKIETVASDIRKYYITNKATGCCYLVTFMVTANNKKLVSCTCPDFAKIRTHGRQCKHINVAYQFHVARMAARAAVETVKAVDTTAPTSYKATSIYSISANGVEKIGKIRIS